ncbi:MAG: holo-[acyl-carrier-protein] synthase [Gammaproteobacteria bacterium]|uniref:Holo-[acyl-carrier-protein] synthase n=1 Tax=OM182 bacterium MED-G24 TaxID=1986255 RepID=A0A2A5WYF6_9GAMM|nr:holo-[acyl-carrier-protein] synthase [Gammaproteobacteria bacterium]PDH41257.1 MAG: holo-[acyl-carrier-protein] synthase [OM182 bacterium MED-G24]|tara:strand:+ start:80 stop:460 length:381 start_codon:yes stop_codon:yes gene_type:complete
MIRSIGVDLVARERIARSIERFGTRFVDKLLDDGERVRFDQLAKDQVGYLARRFAGKEAVAKALGTGMRQGVSFRQIGIRKRSDGSPWVELKGAALERLGTDRIHISLSDERDHAIAWVVIESAKD